MKFIPGDIFDDSFLAPGPIVAEGPGNNPPVDVTALTSLNPLRGKMSAIHASSFFHLFTEEQQVEIARKLGSLLSPEPGSIMIGAQGGTPQKGIHMRYLRENSNQFPMFCHSPESWKELWEEILGKGKVEVKALLKEYHRPDYTDKEVYYLVWSVKRL